MSMIENIKKRRSVRTFDDQKMLGDTLIKNINEFVKNQTNPFNLDITWKILSAKEYNLSSPVIVGESYYILGKLKKDKNAELAFGYEFEEIVLYLTSLGLGTTWIAGTMQRDKFEKVIDLKVDELMPCVSPIGYPNSRMSFRESLMRKGIGADKRLDFNELFYSNDFKTPISKTDLEKYKDILELVRLAPSAVNKQPWRLLICGNTVHFYKKANKGFDKDGMDVQKVDMGIALNHFVQGLKAKNLNYELSCENPNVECDNLEYTISVIVK